MTEFIIIAAAVAVGYIVAAVIMTVFLCNKFVMKKLAKWSYKMTEEIMNDLEDDSISLILKDEA